MSDWKNRIIGTGEESPENLLANPNNFRVHPKFQQDSLQGVLEEVGIVKEVVVNQRTGFLVDGHLRVKLAMRAEQKTIPVTYVDLSDKEEKLILATFDPITYMATTDKEMLSGLLNDIETQNEGVQDLLANISEQYGITPPDFNPVDDTGKLDEKEEKLCPHCGKPI